MHIQRVLFNKISHSRKGDLIIILFVWGGGGEIFSVSQTAKFQFPAMALVGGKGGGGGKFTLTGA